MDFDIRDNNKKRLRQEIYRNKSVFLDSTKMFILCLCAHVKDVSNRVVVDFHKRDQRLTFEEK